VHSFFWPPGYCVHTVCAVRRRATLGRLAVLLLLLAARLSGFGCLGLRSVVEVANELCRVGIGLRGSQEVAYTGFGSVRRGRSSTTHTNTNGHWSSEDNAQEEGYGRAPEAVVGHGRAECVLVL
jgi:hypothetical protein